MSNTTRYTPTHDYTKPSRTKPSKADRAEQRRAAKGAVHGAGTTGGNPHRRAAAAHTATAAKVEIVATSSTGSEVTVDITAAHAAGDTAAVASAVESACDVAESTLAADVDPVATLPSTAPASVLDLATAALSAEQTLQKPLAVDVLDAMSPILAAGNLPDKDVDVLVATVHLSNNPGDATTAELDAAKAAVEAVDGLAGEPKATAPEAAATADTVTVDGEQLAADAVMSPLRFREQVEQGVYATHAEMMAAWHNEVGPLVTDIIQKLMNKTKVTRATLMSLALWFSSLPATPECRAEVCSMKGRVMGFFKLAVDTKGSWFHRMPFFKRGAVRLAFFGFDRALEQIEADLLAGIYAKALNERMEAYKHFDASQPSSTVELHDTDLFASA